MTGGGGRRTQRWPEIWPDHRGDLMNAAHTVWKTCIPAMVCLRPDCDDYRTVDRLQAATVAFSTGISGGESWLQGSTTPAAFVPGRIDDRDAEVDAVLAECGGDHRVAIRALLDIHARLEHDHDRLLLQVS